MGEGAVLLSHITQPCHTCRVFFHGHFYTYPNTVCKKIICIGKGFEFSSQIRKTTDDYMTNLYHLFQNNTERVTFLLRLLAYYCLTSPTWSTHPILSSFVKLTCLFQYLLTNRSLLTNTNFFEHLYQFPHENYSLYLTSSLTLPKRIFISHLPEHNRILL